MLSRGTSIAQKMLKVNSNHVCLIGEGGWEEGENLGPSQFVSRTEPRKRTDQVAHTRFASNTDSVVS